MLNVLVEIKEEKELAVLTQQTKKLLSTKRHVHACLKFTEVEFPGPFLRLYFGRQLLWLAACQFLKKKINACVPRVKYVILDHTSMVNLVSPFFSFLLHVFKKETCQAYREY